MSRKMEMAKVMEIERDGEMDRGETKIASEDGNR